MPVYKPFSYRGWRGMQADSFQLPSPDFDAWVEEVIDTAPTHYPERSIKQIFSPDGEVCYVKILRGLSAHPRRLFPMLKWCLRPSRVLHVWRVSKCLQEHGFGCPDVLLAARKRTHFWPTEVIISRKAAGADLHANLKNAAPDERRRLLQLTARELARFHDAGFVHGDCTPFNIFLDGDNISFIDNDRTVFKRGKPQRNLVQFGYHFDGTDEERIYLLDEYRKAAASEIKIDAVMEKIHWRFTQCPRRQ